MEAIRQFMRHDNGELNLMGKIIVITIMFLISYLITKIINVIINKFLKSRIVDNAPIDKKRFTTVSTLLKSTTGTIVYLVWFLVALGVFNINTRALVTTAGIGGLAIGFAAKTFVEDVIKGLFLILENQYNVGDYIEVAGKKGIVESLTLRRTIIKDITGELHIIPNGHINIVTNKSKNVQRAIARYQISYESDIEYAKQVLMESLNDLIKKESIHLEGPTLLGVTALMDSAVEISFVIYTPPGEQWRIENDMREQGKISLDNAGIEIPYNKLDINLLEKDNA